MNKNFNIYYTFDKITNWNNTIFLAGCTHRIKEGQTEFQRSWRDDVISILSIEQYRYNIEVKSLNKSPNPLSIIIPEWKNNKKPEDWTYSKQVDWERECLEKCSVIIFWIPRSETLLGLTTNIEFGEWHHKKCVVGIPKETKFHVEYIKQVCQRKNIPLFDNLNKCLDETLYTLLYGNIKTFFTADTHFGEKRTLELSKRPFNSVEEMDWTIVKNWNTKISKNDFVYHLGDFGNPEMLKYLNFRKMYLIKGNYDKNIPNEDFTKYGVDVIDEDGMYLQVEKEMVFLTHEPKNIRNHKIGKYLFGHIHKLGMIKENGLNVSIDCHNYSPISEEEVLFYLNAIENHYDENVFMK